MKAHAERSGWTIDSVMEQNINISKYKPLYGSSYIKLPKDLNHSRKGFVNIQNSDDNKCLLWCLVRYLGKKTTLVSKNAGDEKNLHPGDYKFFINWIEVFK